VQNIGYVKYAKLHYNVTHIITIMQTTSNTEENFILWLVCWHCTNDHIGNQFYLANNIIKDILKKALISHWHDPNALTISWVLGLNLWVIFYKLTPGMSLNTNKYFSNGFTWICHSSSLLYRRINPAISNSETWLIQQDYQWKYTILSVEVYNTISESIQYYQWKYTILSVEVYKTISGSVKYYQWKYTILSVEVYNTISIQYYQWNTQYYIQCTCILLVLHSFGSGLEFHL
jgi:hypothetical protein